MWSDTAVVGKTETSRWVYHCWSWCAEIFHSRPSHKNVWRVDIRFCPMTQDFGDIEKRLKYPEVYVPKHWYDIIAETRSGSKPFVVHEMKQEDFLSTTALETAIVNRKTTVDGQKVNWFEMRQIEVRRRRTDPMSLFYKTSHNHGNTLISQGVAIAQCCQTSHRRDCMKDLVPSIHWKRKIWSAYFIWCRPFITNSITTWQLAKLHAVTALKDWRN